MDRLRRQEHRVLTGSGIDRLKGTKHDWLHNPASFALAEWRRFLGSIRTSTLKTARAWRLKAWVIASHWENIKTYFEHRVTNAGAESINSKVQRVKVIARGFRNRERFRGALYFHCGGLDLYTSCLQNIQ